ncbi:MAG: glycosyltransferase family 4 protein, partial [Chloroflexi bacterium]|nr:glycosyltransferase family 4 protein [Chloroflexota bacterium]
DGSKGEDDPRSIRLGSFNLLNHDLITLPGAVGIIEETLRREQVDLAHASLSFSLLDFSLPDICHGLGIPIVATLHFPYDRRLTFWGGGTRVLYRLWAMPLAKYDAVIIFSDEQRQLLIEYGVPPERIQVIPNGVDEEKFSPGPSDYKDKIGAEFLFTYCGRLDPEKNVGSFLRAFLDLNLPPNYKTVVAGEGMEQRLLRERFRHVSIIFEGLVRRPERLVEILRASDVFVLPSAVEGLSLAMLEAMACGVATVATDVGSNGEALAGAGLVINLDHLDGQLRLALRTLSEHPELRRLLGEKGRQRVLERYSLDKNIDRLLEVYYSLVD